MIFNILKKKKAGESTKDEMGFFEHIEQLRWHVVRSAIAILVGAIVVFVSKDFVFNTIIFGPKMPDFFTYRFINRILPNINYYPPELNLNTIALGEQFFIHLTVSFWLGLIAAFPYIFYEFWRFIKPGLYKEEQKATSGLVFFTSFLFIVGILFGYYIIAPVAITFLGSYTVGTEAVNSPTLASYVNYMTMFTIPTGIVFELPIVAYFLGKIGLITSSFMRSYRKHAIVVVFLIAAIVTPPDITTQFLISIPVLVLYEVSIMIVKRIEKKNGLTTSSTTPDKTNE